MDEIHQNLDEPQPEVKEDQLPIDFSGDVGVDIETNVEDTTFINRSHANSENLMGIVVSSENEAYNLYNEYAIRKGFSVRRSRTRYVLGKSNKQELRSKEFCCSKAGSKAESSDSSTRFRDKFTTKSDCKAMIRFQVKDGVWTVNHYVVEHNHELASPSKTYLLRSNRSVSAPKANLISSMVNAGIKTTNVYSYISGEVGGNENVGFIKRDCHNEVNKQKMQMIEAGDAQSLINYFKKQESMDSMFFSDIQVDQENRLTNFFWRDGKSAVDYGFFGDVVIFDTTYRKNRYNLVCAPFIGLNHHRQNIMFGCAFLLDETTDSFVWLFKSFLSSMGGKAPKTIFTDQDQAMSNAIGIVFPGTCHRLCLWHMEKHFPSNLGALNSNSDFQKFFKKCLYDCKSENEFQDTWEVMLDTFNLREHSWLQRLYTLRDKWSLALSNDVFSAGLLSTQRSESTNNVLGDLANRTTSLTQFLIEFEKMVGRWRSSEVEEDFRCNNGKPELSIKNSGILDHALNVYTYKNFKLFEAEFKNAIGLKWSEVSCIDHVYTFQVKSGDNFKVRHVRLDTSTTEISCSCKKFESSGLLCCHALRILNVRNFDTIPERYILPRWGKEARKRWVKEKKSKIGNDGVEMIYRNSMIRFVYNTILKSQSSEVTRTIVQDVLYQLDRDVQVALDKLNSLKIVERGDRLVDEQSEEQAEVHEKNDGIPIRNPPRVKPKGVSNARLKGHFEKRITKAKTGGKAKGKGKKGGSVAKTSKTSIENDHMFMPTNMIVYPPYLPHSQFASTPPLYHASPNMQLLNSYGLPPSFLNTQAANSSSGANTMLQNANQMDYMRHLLYTQQNEPATHLNQNLPHPGSSEK